MSDSIERLAQRIDYQASQAECGAHVDATKLRDIATRLRSLHAGGGGDVRRCHCCGETFDRCRETYRGDSGGWDGGVKACIAWVEARRHAFEEEYGMIDPTTGAMEFRSVAREEYDSELGEIEEGLRSLLAATPQPEAERGEAYPTDSDRAVLLYLMQQFDAESWQCQCGRSEECANMDSAIYLREYLAAAPQPQAEREG